MFHGFGGEPGIALLVNALPLILRRTSAYRLETLAARASVATGAQRARLHQQRKIEARMERESRPERDVAVAILRALTAASVRW